ncbi:MAG TPA: alpha/beta hydrolase [Micromonosporaceae bacterium]|nr:alpha/beta hydrolase [Micromonosporaceae bacterium]
MVAESGEIIQINGIDLFVRGFGDPDLPVLIMAHGGPTWDHSYLLPSAAQLADVRHVVLLDLRGNGRSGRHLPLDQLQPEFVVDDIHALVHHMGVERVDLLGFSFGGSIAMQYAARFPETLRTLVLASACAYDDDLAALLAGVPEYQERVHLARQTDPAEFVDAPDGALSYAMALDSLPLNVWREDRWPEWRTILDRIVFSDDWGDAFNAGGVRRARPADPPAALRAAGVPVLIVQGEHEMSFPLALARRLHDDVPGSQLAVIPDAAHMAHFDNPDAWTRAIRDFLTAPSRKQ